MGETMEHKFLKGKAKKFLVELGCGRVELEYPVNGRTPAKDNFKVDVLGIMGGRKIAVECGGSRRGKLIKLAGLVSEIYIWPYGAEEPYRWGENTGVCNTCGHKIKNNMVREERLIARGYSKLHDRINRANLPP